MRLLVKKGFKPNKGSTEDFMKELRTLADKMVPVYRNRADEKAVNIEQGRQWVLQLLGGTSVKGFRINESKLQGSIDGLRKKHPRVVGMEEDDVIEYLKTEGILKKDEKRQREEEIEQRKKKRIESKTGPQGVPDHQVNDLFDA